jgi:hypothetical protein
MNLRPSDLPARPMPIRVRPYPQETVSSFARRLAVANHLPAGEFLDHIGASKSSSRQPLAPARSRELHLNKAAASRLAVFSGIPASALKRALPGLSFGSADDRPWRAWVPYRPPNRPVRACPVCTVRRQADEILHYQPLHQPICMSHRHWLVGKEDNRRVELDLLPEVIDAARRHMRLTRRREPAALTRAYRLANRIAQRWFDHRSFLTPIWNERYDRIGATHAYGARVITYPETVGLASLLSSPYWTRLIVRSSSSIPAFLLEAGRRIGHPYPENLRNDPLWYWAASQSSTTPAREPRHIDW